MGVILFILLFAGLVSLLWFLLMPAAGGALVLLLLPGLFLKSVWDAFHKTSPFYRKRWIGAAILTAWIMIILVSFI